MNPWTIKRLFKNASASVLAANAGDYGEPHDNNPTHPRQAAKLERDPGNASLAAGEGKETAAGRVLVRVVSIRKRLCDEDNLAEKGFIDCLRYCGAIPDDSPEKVGITTTQRKAAKGEQERTEISITYPEP